LFSFFLLSKQTHENMNTINAFVRFETRESAESALEVNGMEFKSNHLRVDLANQSKKHDNKRSVFLGGLPFGKINLNFYFLLNT
jgi:RNA recognition motif-containing protein